MPKSEGVVIDQVFITWFSEKDTPKKTLRSLF